MWLRVAAFAIHINRLSGSSKPRVVVQEQPGVPPLAIAASVAGGAPASWE